MDCGGGFTMWWVCGFSDGGLRWIAVVGFPMVVCSGGFAVMAGLWVCWVCGFTVMVGLWVFRWWFAVGYRWIAMVGLLFLIFFFFFFNFKLL